jgi:hypothetical protein
MADTPLQKKLGIKPGQRLLVLHAPEGYQGLLGTLPEGAALRADAQGSFDFVQVFVREQADVSRTAATAVQAVKPGGLLWFTYPKKTSGVKTDITRDHGWDDLLSAGLRPVTQIAIDDTWSALRFRPLSEVK